MPGFDEAEAAGRTPARPRAAPSPSVQPTAHTTLVRFGVVVAGSVVLSLAPVAFLPAQDGQMAGSTALATAAVLVVGFIVSRWSLLRFRRAFLAELQAGYVTTTFTQGMFWVGRDPSPRPAGGEDVVGWSWEGLWVLDSSGSVVSEPMTSADPPGLYPSPNVPGERELWTGCRWTGVFPDR